MTQLPDNQKTCINCLELIVPKRAENFKSATYRARLYCSHPCSISMRRRIRHNRPHPKAVQAELDRRKEEGRMDVPQQFAETVVFKERV